MVTAWKVGTREGGKRNSLRQEEARVCLSLPTFVKPGDRGHTLRVSVFLDGAFGGLLVPTDLSRSTLSKL